MEIPSLPRQYAQNVGVSFVRSNDRLVYSDFSQAETVEHYLYRALFLPMVVSEAVMYDMIQRSIDKSFDFLDKIFLFGVPVLNRPILQDMSWPLKKKKDFEEVITHDMIVVNDKYPQASDSAIANIVKSKKGRIFKNFIRSWKNMTKRWNLFGETSFIDSCFNIVEQVLVAEQGEVSEIKFEKLENGYSMSIHGMKQFLNEQELLILWTTADDVDTVYMENEGVLVPTTSSVLNRVAYFLVDRSSDEGIRLSLLEDTTEKQILTSSM